LFEFSGAEIIQYSRAFAIASPNVHGTKKAHAAAAPLLVKTFPKTPRTTHDLKHPG
jgi:hypothetical protein